MAKRKPIRHDEIIAELERRLEAARCARQEAAASCDARPVTGQRELARRFKLSNTTICHWKGDGIPSRHWPKLLAIAAEAGCPLTLEQLAAGSPLTSRQPRRAA